MRSYRERKWALGKSADFLPIPPIQRELARREKIYLGDAVSSHYNSSQGDK